MNTLPKSSPSSPSSPQNRALISRYQEQEERQRNLGDIEKQNIARVLNDRMLSEGFEIVTEGLPLPSAAYAFRKKKAFFADIPEVADEHGKSPVMLCVVDVHYALYVVAAMPMEQETDPGLQDYDIEDYGYVDKVNFPTALIARRRIALFEREDVDVWMDNIRTMYSMAEIKFLRDGKSATHAKTLPSYSAEGLVNREALHRKRERQNAQAQEAFRAFHASMHIRYQAREIRKRLSILGAVIGTMVVASGAIDTSVQRMMDTTREAVMTHVYTETAAPIVHTVTAAEDVFMKRKENIAIDVASSFGGGVGGALAGYGIGVLAGRALMQKLKRKK